jgi:hypothetical protein
MSFSLRSTFVAVAWTAWLFGSLKLQHGLVPELFVLAQFALLAVSIPLTLQANARLKLFGICFASGFFAWFFLLAAEQWFSDAQVYRIRPIGWRIWEIVDLLVDRTTSRDTFAVRISTINGVIRTALGSLWGALTYACVSWFISRQNARSDAE